MIELLQVPHTHALLFVTLVAALLALAHLAPARGASIRNEPHPGAGLFRERLCYSGLDRVQILERVLHTTGPEA